MDTDFLYKMKKVEEASRLFAHMNTKAVDEAIARIKSIEDFLKKYNGVYDLAKELEEIKQKIYVCREMLTIEEAANYLGLSISKMYKMTSRHEITFYKPRGKQIYFDRKDLDALLRTNPFFSTKERERRAVVAVMVEEQKKATATRSRKKGGSK